MAMVKQFDVYMCDVKGIEKPCLIVSPNELNELLTYVIIAPITNLERRYPCRVFVGLKGQKAQIALDMIQTVQKKELTQKIGVLPDSSHAEIRQILIQMFS